jgi:putative NADH-flavin reductase
MKILIIGGTGATGKQLIQQALSLGLKVTVLARHPEKLRIEHANLIIIKGNVLDYQSVSNAMQSQQAVLSALGHKRFFIPTKTLSEGSKNIIRAMNENGVKRLICITSLGINESRFKLGLYYTLFVIPFIIFFYFRDKALQERLIEKSNLDWTIVQPGQLTNGKKREKYKVGKYAGHSILIKMISRADVAHFMLHELLKPSHLHQKTGISY